MTKNKKLTNEKDMTRLHVISTSYSYWQLWLTSFLSRFTSGWPESLKHRTSQCVWNQRKSLLVYISQAVATGVYIRVQFKLKKHTKHKPVIL